LPPACRNGQGRRDKSQWIKFKNQNRFRIYYLEICYLFEIYILFFVFSDLSGLGIFPDFILLFLGGQRYIYLDVEQNKRKKYRGGKSRILQADILYICPLIT